MKRVLAISLIILAVFSHSNLANAKSLPNFNTKKFCGSDKGCVKSQKDWKKHIKELEVWDIVTPAIRKECEGIARASNSNGDYWLLSDCLFESLE